jgi:hypothetical protein
MFKSSPFELKECQSSPFYWHLLALFPKTHESQNCYGPKQADQDPREKVLSAQDDSNARPRSRNPLLCQVAKLYCLSSCRFDLRRALARSGEAKENPRTGTCKTNACSRAMCQLCLPAWPDVGGAAANFNPPERQIVALRKIERS